MKRARTYRLSEGTLAELREIAATLGISETEAVARSIHHYHQALKGEAPTPTEVLRRLEEKLDRLLEARARRPWWRLWG
ncbi:hypothetical protein [Thermus sp.]|uniref:hypothetical protein n=1 Tax=Thermus sp. TaxID=275 RepID=UPI0025DC87C9|nr:hypothetical protein [Thermus sp.]MCS6867781.1 hypothetical protein [Thermus sp.]MDW8358377.1 hypothetical protein [Thermus sp.]